MVNKILVESSYLDLPQDHAHLWIWDTKEISFAADEKLSVIEIKRMQGMREDLRQNYLNVHHFLKKILQRYFKKNQGPLDHFSMKMNEYGKLFLSGPFANLQFNLSHSEDYAALLVAWLHPVGVDLENRQREYHPNIVERFFSEKEKQYYNGAKETEKASVFYSIWTKKEALVKATGLGIAYGKWSQFTVNPYLLSQTISNQDANWKIISMTIKDNYPLAAVFFGGLKWLTCYNLIESSENKIRL